MRRSLTCSGLSSGSTSAISESTPSTWYLLTGVDQSDVLVTINQGQRRMTNRSTYARNLSKDRDAAGPISVSGTGSRLGHHLTTAGKGLCPLFQMRRRQGNSNLLHYRTDVNFCRAGSIKEERTVLWGDWDKGCSDRETCASLHVETNMNISCASRSFTPHTWLSRKPLVNKFSRRR